MHPPHHTIHPLHPLPETPAGRRWGTHIIETAPSECIACVLGGPDRRTLFLGLASEPAGR